MKNRLRLSIIKTLPLFAVLSLLIGKVVIVQAADQFAWGGLNPSCFSYPAVAMTPYDRSIQADLYRMTHERVYHNSNATGTILLYGPVHPWNESYGDGVNFKATFIDPDGEDDTAQVIAELRFVGPGGITFIAKLDSNDHAVATSDVQTMSTPVTWRHLGYDEGYYVVRIYVTRTNTGVVPAAFGYNLCSAIW